MIKGFDCFDTPSATILRRARELGFQVICQYYGSPGSAKITTADEARRISDAGLLIFSVFEKVQGRPLQGGPAGSQDGALALIQARAAGQPGGTTIAFAVDTDVDTGLAQNRDALMNYFVGVRGAFGSNYRIGGYGSGDVLSLLLGSNLIEVAWLVGAMGWAGSREFDSEGKWDIKQYPTLRADHSDNELGIEYDPDDIRDLEKIGAWSLAPVVALPATAGSRTGSIDVFKLQADLKAAGYYRGVIDGWAGNQTADALKRYSAATRPK